MAFSREALPARCGTTQLERLLQIAKMKTRPSEMVIKYRRRTEPTQAGCVISASDGPFESRGV